MARKFDIAGMTADTYDADRDPSGAIGMALADAIIREAGGFREYFRAKRAAQEYNGRFQRACRIVRVDSSDVDVRTARAVYSLMGEEFVSYNVAKKRTVLVPSEGIIGMFKRDYRRAFPLSEH